VSRGESRGTVEAKVFEYPNRSLGASVEVHRGVRSDIRRETSER